MGLGARARHAVSPSQRARVCLRGMLTQLSKSFTKWVMRPAVWRQISGPVDCSCAHGFHSLSYWFGRNAPGVSRTRRQAGRTRGVCSAGIAREHTQNCRDQIPPLWILATICSGKPDSLRQRIDRSRQPRPGPASPVSVIVVSQCAGCHAPTAIRVATSLSSPGMPA